MKLTRTSVVTFFISAILGVVGGFLFFRASLIFTPLRHEIQFQFIEACRWGDTRSMERLHLAGASATAFAEHGGGEPVGPPIIEAAEHARPEAVQWLIDHGASVNVWVSDGWSPLGAARTRVKDAQRTLDILNAHGAKLAHEQDSK